MSIDQIKSRTLRRITLVAVMIAFYAILPILLLVQAAANVVLVVIKDLCVLADCYADSFDEAVKVWRQ